MRVLLYPLMTSSKSPTAVEHSVWPCFHLNSPLNAPEWALSDLGFGLSRNGCQKPGTSGA